MYRRVLNERIARRARVESHFLGVLAQARGMLRIVIRHRRAGRRATPEQSHSFLPSYRARARKEALHSRKGGHKIG